MEKMNYGIEQVEKKLLLKLQEAEAAVKEETNWMTLDEMKAKFEV